MLFRNKKKHDLNAAKWIGVGGHLEEGESKEEALFREVFEETGLTINSYEYRGELLFVNDDFEEIMYLYTSNNFSGKLKECDEGELHWVNKDKIMELNLWEGDKAFLPLLINTKQFIRLKLIYKQSHLVEVIKWEEEYEIR
jgi:8-oxo-dGTP diphosphatase